MVQLHHCNPLFRANDVVRHGDIIGKRSIVLDDGERDDFDDVKIPIAHIVVVHLVVDVV